MRRSKDPWQKLVSGLFVPPYLKFAPGYPCCCGSVCEFCNGLEHTPVEFEIVVPVIPDGTCAQCDQFEGTFVASQLDEPFACFWTYNYPGQICGLASRVNVLVLASDVAVTLIIGSNTAAAWRTTKPDDDCDTWSGVELPYISRVTPKCSAAGTTVVVSAL